MENKNLDRGCVCDTVSNVVMFKIPRVGFENSHIYIYCVRSGSCSVQMGEPVCPNRWGCVHSLRVCFLGSMMEAIFRGAEKIKKDMQKVYN